MKNHRPLQHCRHRWSHSIHKQIPKGLLEIMFSCRGASLPLWATHKVMGLKLSGEACKENSTRDSTFVFPIETVLSAHCGLGNFSALFLRTRCVSCFPKKAAAADWNKICTSSLPFSRPHHKNKVPCFHPLSPLCQHCLCLSLSLCPPSITQENTLPTLVFIAAFIQLVNDKDMCKVMEKACFFIPKHA